MCLHIAGETELGEVGEYAVSMMGPKVPPSKYLEG